MKVLVLWISANPRTTSVVDKKDIKIFGEIVKAKWEKKWFDVKIVAENDDENWLNSLTVSTEGKIIKPTCSTENSILALKRQKRQENKISQQRKKQSIEEIDQSIEGRSIFDEVEQEENEVSDEDIFQDIAEENLKGNHSPKQQSEKRPSSVSKKIEIEVEKKNRSAEDHCYFCRIYTEDCTYGDKVIAILESAVAHIKGLKRYENDSEVSNQIPLVPGSNITINRYKLHDFQRFSKGDAKALTRYLLKELLSEEELSKLSASTIPENIFKAVERYVNTNVKKVQILSLSEFKRCITLYCSSLKIKLDGKKLNKSKKSEFEKNDTQQKETFFRNHERVSGRASSLSSIDRIIQESPERSSTNQDQDKEKRKERKSRERSIDKEIETFSDRSESEESRRTYIEDYIIKSQPNRNGEEEEKSTERKSRERSKEKGLKTFSHFNENEESLRTFSKDLSKTISSHEKENNRDKQQEKYRENNTRNKISSSREKSVSSKDRNSEEKREKEMQKFKGRSERSKSREEETERKEKSNHRDKKKKKKRSRSRSRKRHHKKSRRSIS